MSAASQRRTLRWIVAAFLGLQLIIIASDVNGPFVDEALYTVAGLRVLEGHGLADGYLTWFNGSPFVWPVAAALGYHAGVAVLGDHAAGVAGARVVAALFSTVTLLAFAKAAEHLFGFAVARWGALALGINGLFMALAHFAVYDVAALAFLAVSMWCLTRVAAGGGGGVSVDASATAWVIAGAAAFAGAIISKHVHVLTAVPLLGLLVAVREGARGRRDVVVFVAVVGTIVIAYFSPLFGTPFPTSNTYFQQAFGRTRAHIAMLQVVFGVLPLALAIAGAVVVWRSGRRTLVVSCLLALAVYPAFHVWAANFVSGQKHVVAGFLFGYLLAGVALERLWTARSRMATVALLAVLATWGALQCYWQDRSWSDTRPLAAHLATHVRPGERVLAELPWTYTLPLYASGRITSPRDVIDAHVTPPAERSDVCAIGWVVGNPDSSALVRDVLARCGHEPVLSSTTHHYYFDASRFRLATYPARVSIYRLPRPSPSASLFAR